ncbi:hypothetical protein HYH03_019158 [Edaphochlamys debaryana]|uniref:Uncharacterized protein n=1 Tax=Edaphochlamys debaryana TaxID=47281 RepID=A0A835XGE9_9CHLO|nr:hypothetical protein HYH03_019158 [Edaphochlamys debaryana]|eukprot:KAG2481881.1 hypothetical protein HYH03_019158 [Edaphochlamys debaryana]
MRRRWRSCISEEPAAAAALIKLHAAALRPSGGDGAGAVDVAGSLVTEEWRRRLISTVAAMLSKATPLPPSPPALSVLRFVRAMLRAQPFHALGRQLAAAAGRFRRGQEQAAAAAAAGWRATVEAVRLAAGALACGRLLLPRQRPSPRLEAQRAEWWRLAVWVSAISAHEPEDYLQRVGGLVVEPLLAVWPDGRLDLDALPPVAPPDVAAALACGLLSSLCPHVQLPIFPQPAGALRRLRRGPPGRARPSRSSSRPCWRTGTPGSCQLALVTLGMMTARGTGTGLFAHMGGSEGDAEQRRSDTGPYRRASEGFFRGGLGGHVPLARPGRGRCGDGGVGLGRCAAAAGPAPSAAAGQPAATGAGNSAAAAGSGAAAEAPPPHLLQFKQMYDFAQAWRQEVSAPGPPAGAGSALATVTAFAAAFRATSAAPIGSNSSSTASAEEVRRGESGRGVGLGLGARPGNAAAKGADATAEGAGSAAATAAGAASVQAGAGRSAASSAGAAASPSAEGSGSAAATASPSASPAAADPCRRGGRLQSAGAGSGRCGGSQLAA